MFLPATTVKVLTLATALCFREPRTTFSFRCYFAQTGTNQLPGLLLLLLSATAVAIVGFVYSLFAQFQPYTFGEKKLRGSYA